MKAKFAVAVVLALVLAGCAQSPSGQQQGNDSNATGLIGGVEMGSSIKVENGDMVKVEYVGKFTDGTVFDKSEGRGPLEFEVGAGQMIKGFDKGVVGMSLNEEKSITVAPEDAYGAAGSGQEVQIPISQIRVDGNLEVGAQLSTSTGMSATVTAIKDGVATLLVQHPLAGKTLVFSVKVVDIQKGAK